MPCARAIVAIRSNRGPRRKRLLSRTFTGPPRRGSRRIVGRRETAENDWKPLEVRPKQQRDSASLRIQITGKVYDLVEVRAEQWTTP